MPGPNTRKDPKACISQGCRVSIACRPVAIAVAASRHPAAPKPAEAAEPAKPAEPARSGRVISFHAWSAARAMRLSLLPTCQ
ncbi:MAG: hypothetical protein ACRDOU_19735 [Streptosporangiaceae bacterium]